MIAGDSSGGHTAMFAGMLREGSRDELLAELIQEDAKSNLFPGVSADVKGIVNYYGSCSVMAGA